MSKNHYAHGKRKEAEEGTSYGDAGENDNQTVEVTGTGREADL